MEVRVGRPSSVICFFLLLSAVSNSVARFVVKKNSLAITSPEKIKGNQDTSIGNFGIPQYGGSMAGTVMYPKDNRKGCKEFADFGISFKSKPGSLPAFVLVDRGDCYFTLKVWNAQKAGASAVLVADNIEEPLITIDTPEKDISPAKYIENITIPSALITKGFGETLKTAISGGDMVNVNLDWREAVPHPDERVEYELWTNSNVECGVKCDMLMKFMKDFRDPAQILEKGGFTQFTPHYITWYCPQAFTLSRQCKSLCINHGRYCAPDTEQYVSSGYDGKDVVLENLRQLCVFKVANESKKPWVWWNYVTDFQIRCPMKEKKYNKECADTVIKSLGLDDKKIDKCMGDPNADADNPVMKEEQDAQVGKGSRGDVTISPTLLVNNRQYRGKLEKGAVLKAICSGFEETTVPAVCLSDGKRFFTNRDQRHLHKKQDALQVDAPYLKAPVNKESEKISNVHQEEAAKLPSDPKDVPRPRSFFQHDGRDLARQAGRSFGRRGYNSGGDGRTQKWKHDLFQEANRSPSPKNEEDQIAKVEALLAS